MKSALTLAQLGLIANSVYAHYFFPSFIVNNTVTPYWKHVRDIGKPDGASNPGEFDKNFPLFEIGSQDMTCGREAYKAAAKTEAADVIAGQQVGFHVDHEKGASPDWINYIFHPGPAQVYMARAPNDDLSTFTGYDGKWFKIASITAAEDTTPNPVYWITYHKTSIEFSIPEKTPPGKYLLRLEHFQAETKDLQFYIACAHVNVIGPGGGSLEGYDFAKFPGTYNLSDPAFHFDKEFWSKPNPLLTYVGPGPKVWTGE